MFTLGGAWSICLAWHIMVWDQHQILGCKFGWGSMPGGSMPGLAYFSWVWNIDLWLGQLICILLADPLTRL